MSAQDGACALAVTYWAMRRLFVHPPRVFCILHRAVSILDRGALKRINKNKKASKQNKNPCFMEGEGIRMKVRGTLAFTGGTWTWESNSGCYVGWVSSTLTHWAISEAKIKDCILGILKDCIISMGNCPLCKFGHPNLPSCQISKFYFSLNIEVIHQLKIF